MKSKRCPCCEEVIPYEKRRNRFCGHACAARFNNRARRRVVVCAGCGQPIRRGKYCSIKCQQALIYRRYIARWLRGKESGVVSGGLEISNHIKRWLRETRGEKCELCDWAERHEVTGRVPIQVSHKNGNATDNKPGNLELLCPNCHALTPTFGALNKGHGRTVRYKVGQEEPR